ncbi:MAG: diguanylate cyclase [Actinomycetota bacterium]
MAIADRALGNDRDALIETRLESYKRLAEIFHLVLSEQHLGDLLERVADTLSDLIPYDTLTIYQAHETEPILLPVLARDQYADEIMNDQVAAGEGLTGWAVEHREPVWCNEAHLDARMVQILGTPSDEKEAVIIVPLVARGALHGALNIYRLESGPFDEEDFELAKRFGDAVALALDNARGRAQLEQLAHTDSLTGLYNHRFFYERLRAELTRASRIHDSVTVLMLDIDDFKKLNDVYGHGVGDQVLVNIAEILNDMVRASDVVCRLGGEEFTIIMPSCGAGDALGLASRLTERLSRTDFDPAGGVSMSVGVAQGPEHAMNPRELVACAEAAMMTAKARGKNRVVLFEEDKTERPDATSTTSRDVRSIAHLKMLQSLAGKLNRLNDVQKIGMTIANELRTLIDYHNARVYIEENGKLVPIAFRGELSAYQGEEWRSENLVCEVGEGITGRAALTRTSLLIHNALECDFAEDVEGTDEIEESMIAVPLSYGTRVIGVIVVSKLGVGQFDEDDVRLIEVLGGNASVALENARLYEAQKRDAERAREAADIAQALLEFSRTLTMTEADFEEVADAIVEQAGSILGCEQISLWLQKEEGGPVVPVGYSGYSDTQREQLDRFEVPAELMAQFIDPEPFVLRSKDLTEVKDYAASMGLELENDRLVGVAPMSFDGRHGWLVVAVPVEGEKTFSERELRLLGGVAHQAQLAISNAARFDDLEDTFLSTVEALANALEAKDEYTSSHARWITDMSLEVGQALSIDDDRIKSLELGALFHDIGKIGIPHEILLKPGPLTDEEWTVMRTHPELGERILAPIVRLSEVRRIVRHCHERFDGDGYPDGSVGDEIPLEARIIFVCDAFHAMTTDRPYRKALPVEEALRRLDEGAGTQFDPDVVTEFCTLVRERAGPFTRSWA